jgi:uncharacterized protein YabE (DUF348 family)/3D (Asp-Asp-Asp) domain-containing protein
VQADGATTVVVSRDDELSAIFDDAGLEQQAGDLIIQAGNAITVERALPVVVEVDGQALGWRTRATSVEGLLNELAIEVSPHDGVFVSGFRVGLDQPLSSEGEGPVAHAVSRALQPGVDVPGLVLSIERAVPLTIIEDGLAATFHSIQPTLGQALAEAGVHIGPADEIFPSPATALTAGMEVDVRHAKAVSLIAGGSTQIIYTHTEVLQEALAEVGLVLGPEDRVEPSLEAEVTDGMTARLVRVSGQQLFEREDVLHKTVFEPDETLSGINTRRVEGSDGVRVREYNVVIEDGEEVRRELVEEYMEPEVVDTVIYYAAANVQSTGLTPERYDVAETLHMWATWYNAASSGKAATDASYGITRSGLPLTRGIVAVDQAVIPLGTRLYIPGYGFAVAGDTGGGIKGDMIDLGYPDGVPVDWRTGWVDVYILSP